MSTKHLYNSQDGLVLKALEGSVALNPTLRLHAPSKSVYVAKPSTKARVAVISGGGAGHEPAHAGYTGLGMLAASVSGEIFASPSAKQICDTIALTKAPSILVIINNYTGDRLNFGLAIEKARSEGVEVESVIVADDVSLPEARGLAGNILVCKILGALAERGADLQKLKSLGDAVVQNLASVGVGLDHCNVPGREELPKMKHDECEIGLGLHNERGVSRETFQSPRSLVDKLVQMLQKSPQSEPFLEEGDAFVLYINNLGGMSQLEMNAIMGDCMNKLENLNMHPERIYMSSYMTSLNAPGFSISLLNISKAEKHLVDCPDIFQLLDDPTEAVSWTGAKHPAIQSRVDVKPQHVFFPSGGGALAVTSEGTEFWRDNDISCQRVKQGIIRSCNAVLEMEKQLTGWDSVVGDGDCGATFASGARAILGLIDAEGFDLSKLPPSELVRKLGSALEDAMGGTIGALFAIFFFSWASALSVDELSSNNIFRSFINAFEALSKYTPAKIGDCTLIDALEPFCKTTTKDRVKAAQDGAEKTRSMRATLGRSAYIPKGEQGEIPDPGAMGVAALLNGFYEGYLS